MVTSALCSVSTFTYPSVCIAEAECKFPKMTDHIRPGPYMNAEARQMEEAKRQVHMGFRADGHTKR